MSAKTQKTWRELCQDLHNEQESGNLMDMLSELNGALEQRVVEMTPPEGLSAPQQDSIPLLRRSVQPQLTEQTLDAIIHSGQGRRRVYEVAQTLQVNVRTSGFIEGRLR